MDILTIYAKIGWVGYCEININQLEAYILAQSDRLLYVISLYNKLLLLYDLCV